MLRLSKKTDYALMAMKHLASAPGRRAASAREIAETYDIPPLHRIRDRIAAILAECSIAEMAADPDPWAPPVTLMSSPVVRRAPAVSAAPREP